MSSSAVGEPATSFEYTRTQALLVEYIVYFSVPFSLIGSSLIIWVILNERRSLAKSVYHRIMLGMSVLDFFNSLGMIIFGPWAVPAQETSVVNARGTFATCEASGFFLVSSG